MFSVANIEKLSSDNYSTWAVQVKSLLTTLELWDVIVTKCPEDQAQKAVWTIADQKALATIHLSVKSSELIHIKNCVKAKDAWDILSDLYKANTACRKVNLFKQLVRFKIKPAEKVSSQIGEFCSIIDDLKSIGIELNEDFASVLLLCTLPDEMENFVVAIESRDQLPTLKQLVSKILEEERRQGVKGDGNEERILWANANSEYSRNRKNKPNFFKRNKSNGKSQNLQANKNKNNNNKSNSSIECYKCHGRGHIRSQCPQSAEYQTAASAFSAVSGKLSSDTWILDSGATSHMSPNKEMFETIESWKQRVFLASGDCVYSAGKGTIKVKTEHAKIDLLNVLFVPDLHCNFLSMSKVLKAGNRIIFSENGAIVKNKLKQQLFVANEKDDIFLVEFESAKQSEIAKAHTRTLIVKNGTYGLVI